LGRFRVFGDRQEHRRPIRHTRPTVSTAPVGTARARRRLGLRPRLSPDGRLFVEGSWQGDLLVRSAETRDVVLRERLQGMVPQIAATGDRLRFAYAVIGPPGPSVWTRRWPFDRHPGTRVGRYDNDARALA